MKCSVCKANTGTKSTIINGHYFKSICPHCYHDLTNDSMFNSGSAQYDRDRDYEDNLADVIQPFSGGKASSEFIHLYPEKAQKLMSQDEIDQATRR